METFSALLALCAGNSAITGEFPTQRPVTRSFDVFFDLRVNKRSNKQSWGWWFETPASSLWRHCSAMCIFYGQIRTENRGLTSLAAPKAVIMTTFDASNEKVAIVTTLRDRQPDHLFLSGEPDYFGRNKILSGYDLSHYQVPHCIRVFFYFVWFVFIHHNFQFCFKLCTYCNILDIYLS